MLKYSGCISRKINNLHLHKSNMSNIGLIIIGNEILNGQVKDENSIYIAQSLPILGLKLKKISIIPDEIDIISKEVMEFSKTFDYVITSGGIGTTHDDITFEGVSAAFNESVHQHKDLTAKLIELFNLTGEAAVSDAKLKLARIPESAKLTFGIDSETGATIPYPVVSTRNVFILPGIPSLFKKGFNIIKKNLIGNSKKFFTGSLYFRIEESKLTDSLNQIVEEFNDSVLFGSYPVLNNNFYKVKITMEAKCEQLIQSASERLKNVIGKDNISSYDPLVFEKASEKVYSIASQNKVQSALEVIHETFEKFQLNEIIIAFTGGKDCTVLMHLIYAYMQRNYQNNSMIRALFCRTRPSFKEVEEFIKLSLGNYKIIPPKSNFLEYNGMIKICLQSLKNEHPEIKAVFMGTKSNDPNGKQEKFSKTTEGWPEFELINPIIDWNYGEIWKFLLDLSIPYCSLYDRGYTSLGGIDNTLPNPKLLYTDENGKSKYHPAYLLKEESFERIGR